MENGRHETDAAALLVPPSYLDGCRDEGAELPEEIEIPELLAYKLRALFAEQQLVQMQAETLMAQSEAAWVAGIAELREALTLGEALDEYQINLQTGTLTRKVD
jgi:hypothetical protein